MNEEKWKELTGLCKLVFPDRFSTIEIVIGRLKQLYNPDNDQEIVALHAEYAANKMYVLTTIVGIYLVRFGGW